MSKIWIGIDPDTDKNGVAIWYKDSKELVLKNLSFFELFSLLSELKTAFDIQVIVDAGWLNKKTNFRQKFLNKKTGQYEEHSIGVKEKMAGHTFANHETGKKIVEMCEFLSLAVSLNKPTRSKSNAERFKAVTGYVGRTNQETRDAGLLVFGR